MKSRHELCLTISLGVAATLACGAKDEGKADSKDDKPAVVGCNKVHYQGYTFSYVGCEPGLASFDATIMEAGHTANFHVTCRDGCVATVTVLPPDPLAGMCKVPEMICSGACVDVATDAMNCGGCGETCACENCTGACSGGRCLINPTQITSEGSPDRFVIDGTHVYWMEPIGGDVKKAPLAGGAVVTLAEGTDARTIAVTATDVYWTTYERAVLKVPIAGGPVAPVAMGQYRPQAITADATSAYWTESEIGGGRVMKGNGQGGAVTLASGGDPGEIAVDAANVYWVDRDANAVKKVPLGGGAATVLASISVGCCDGIAVDATNVYWTGDGQLHGTVMKVALSGGQAKELVSGQNATPGLVVDETSAYWTNFDGSVMRLPLAGGRLGMMARGQTSPRGIAVDATHVYWVRDSRSVMKVAK